MNYSQSSQIGGNYLSIILSQSSQIGGNYLSIIPQLIATLLQLYLSSLTILPQFGN